MKVQRSKKKVLIISNFLSRAGFNRSVCEDFAERLHEAGWTVITTSSKHAPIPRLFDMMATVWRERYKYVFAQVDVFSGPSFMWAEAVCGLLRKLHKPIVLTLHGGNLPQFARHWPGRVRHLLAFASAVTTPSRYLLEAMQPYRSDIRLIPNPIDLRAYPFRHRVNPKPRFIWLRAFHAIYNPTMAPRILAELIHDFPDALLIMIGPDKGDGSFKSTQSVVESMNLNERVQFPGRVPKSSIPYWLNQGDVFINTTNVDNTPVSVLEAMSCGLCVVSTDVGGIPYLLEHEQDALLVPPDDPRAMASAVRRILTESNIASRLSSNARREAEKYNWDIVLPQWELLLQEIINFD